VRWPVFLLALLVVALQYPLWLGDGGWLAAWEVSRKVVEQQRVNEDLERRNAGLEAEVVDLKDGLEAVEEQARFELGLTRPGEIYVQIPQVPRVQNPEPPPFVIPPRTKDGRGPTGPVTKPQSTPASGR